MSVLITDPSGGVWEKNASGEGGRSIPGDLEWPCMPCACLSCAAFACQKTRRCLCVDRRSFSLISQMPSVPGVCGMALSPCGRFLYQLSAEADCVHTRCTATGDLLFAAPAGVFPRMLNLRGRQLLIAGGAVNEACLLSAPELKREQTITTRHPCFGADFDQEGLTLVCAMEGEDIHTAVYRLKAGKLRPRKIAELPGEPGGVCVCPDGRHALLSTGDGLMKMNLDTGLLLWNRPEWAHAMRIECRGEWALASDTMDGCAWLFSHHRPWEKRLLLKGSAAQACFM